MARSSLNLNVGQRKNLVTHLATQAILDNELNPEVYGYFGFYGVTHSTNAEIELFNYYVNDLEDAGMSVYSNIGEFDKSKLSQKTKDFIYKKSSASNQERIEEAQKKMFKSFSNDKKFFKYLTEAIRKTSHLTSTMVAENLDGTELYDNYLKYCMHQEIYDTLLPKEALDIFIF